MNLFQNIRYAYCYVLNLTDKKKKKNHKFNRKLITMFNFFFFFMYDDEKVFENQEVRSNPFP